MGFLDRLLGRSQERPQPGYRPADRQAYAAATPGAGRGGPGDSDDRAIARYRYLLRTAPPETIEQAHAEAFAQLTPEQRRQVLSELGQGLPASERTSEDDPRSLARMATRAEMRQPGTLERAFGGGRLGGLGMGGAMGGGVGMGGMIAGTLLASVAGTVIGSSIASAFLNDNDDGDRDAGDSSDSDARDSSDSGDSGDAAGSTDVSGDSSGDNSGQTAGDFGGGTGGYAGEYGGGYGREYGGGGDFESGDVAGGDFGGGGDF